MKRWIFLVLVLIAHPAGAEDFCEPFRRAQPQSTPQATYRLELDMMKQGVYCYDLPIFDSGWQKRAAQNSRNESFKTTAQFFDVPFKVREDGDYAILYYPEARTLGPVFPLRDHGAWILDRSSTFAHIRYGREWMARDGDYPYLELLKKSFYLEEGTSGDGHKVYRIKRDPAPE